jgi:hypothetical protein
MYHHFYLQQSIEMNRRALKIKGETFDSEDGLFATKLYQPNTIDILISEPDRHAPKPKLVLNNWFCRIGFEEVLWY